MIGKTIAHYRVEEKLGEGGMGKVYLARDINLGRKVALKFLPPKMQQDELARKRFHREARSAAALDQPFICKIYETGQTDEGDEFIAMEYVEGVTLKEKLAERPLKPEESIRIVLEICGALEVAHQKGIVHRDLKPANIMLTRQGHVKVMDFGLAKRVLTEVNSAEDLTSGLTQQGTTLGTPAYMSPEQIRAQAADLRSDIFSLGIILYEMLSGAHPFKQVGMVETMGAILHKEPEPLSARVRENSDRIGELVQQMLAKDPQQRYQSIEEVVIDLKALESAGQFRPGNFLKRHLYQVAILAGIIVMTAVGLSWWIKRSEDSPGEGDRINSIVVLPLANRSGDPNQEYFADGMTEALITDLSKIGALKVTSRTSTMRYKNTILQLTEIAEELNVDAVVEGSVLREGDRIGITAQLIDVATEQSLWAERFEREWTSILALQSELARTIARQIKVSLTPREEELLTSPDPVNPEAYEAYLKGKFHWYKLTPQDLEIALEYFKLAIQKDPDYALPYVGYADALATPAHIGLKPATDVFPQAKASVLRALELDDNLAEAHDFLARVHFTWDWDWEAAEKEFLRSIELNPNYPDVQVVYSQFLALTGRWDKAISEVEEALKSDPYNAFYQHQLGARLAQFGRYEEATVQAQKMLKANPNSPITRRLLWQIYAKRGMFLEAGREAERYFELVGKAEVSKALSEGFESGGYSRAMELAGDGLTKLSEETYISAVTIAEVYAHAGLEEKALDWLERAYQEHESRLVYIKIDPPFEGMRNDPRFLALLRKMNLAQN